MTRKVMVARVYSTFDGGPLDASGVLTSACHRLRSSLKRYGWTISKGKSGQWSPGVCLEPVDTRTRLRVNKN
jgi:DNA-binding IclR family transcriptional regulator